MVLPLQWRQSIFRSAAFGVYYGRMPFMISLVSIPPDKAFLYQGSSDPILVILSVVVVIFASYVALLASSQASTAENAFDRRKWVAAGGLCLGAGIWAMHFVGMLAFSLPCGAYFERAATLLSMVPGVLSGVILVVTLSRPSLSTPRLIIAGALLGAGVGTMHYSGMSALKFAGTIQYDASLFILSVVVAVLFSCLALWARQRLPSLGMVWDINSTRIGAVLLGLAVATTHYLAMAAAYFVKDKAVCVPIYDVVAPTFVASCVLLVAGLIIVLTMVANLLSKPSLAPLATHYRTISIIIGIWIATAWLISDYYIQRLEFHNYQQAAAASRQSVTSVADNIEYELFVQDGLTSMMARDHDIRAMLHDADSKAPKQFPDTVNDFLANAATHLNTDVVYIVRPDGLCVAASNAGTSMSFIGVNYATRGYFTQAMSGRNGVQYAMGRVTKIAGLYTSQPIFDEGTVIGAAVVKRDVSGLQRWTKQADAFLTDANGVVIQANKPELLGHIIPFAANLSAPKDTQDQSGLTTDLPTIPVVPWRNGRFPDVVRFGESGMTVILSSKQLLDGVISVHVPHPAPELDKVESERWWVFILLSVAGSMMVTAAAAVTLYIRTVGQAKRAIDRQAMELNRSKDDLERFTTVLAHHIQEPVRLQHLFAQRLVSSLNLPMPDQARKSLDYIVANALRLRELISDVQRYLAIGYGHATPRPCEGGRALSVALAKVQPDLIAIGASFEAEPLPRVQMDESQLADVFLMLLRNSITYRVPERQLRIRVHAQVNREMVTLCVTDNGRGIAPEYRSRVFQVFERLHSSQVPGTGIGLALVKKSVESVDGQAWIEDGDNGGTSVRLLLRLA